MADRLVFAQGLCSLPLSLVRNMSSLAGALASPVIDIKPLLTDNYVPESISQSNFTRDVDMKPAEPEDEKPDAHEDEGMGDLFGEERDIDFVKHEQYGHISNSLDHLITLDHKGTERAECA